jgi:hypothetical protein
MHVSLCTFFMGVQQDHPIIRRGINSGAAARERIYAAPLGSLVHERKSMLILFVLIRPGKKTGL